MTAHAEDMTTLAYSVPRARADWDLSEEQMPESELHVDVVDLIASVLREWARSSGARIVRNLAVRWVKERPSVGVDPDVAVLDPSPPEESLFSVRTWAPGHSAPVLALEVVSDADPRKDYEVAPEKYGASGTRELVIFDPRLVGPRSFGGPILLQVWRRQADGTFSRVYAGEGPAYSSALAAYLVVTNDGRRLRVATDAAASTFWLSTEERERSEKEAALAEADANRREADANRREADANRREADANRREADANRREADAQRARVAELEAELARRR